MSGYTGAYNQILQITGSTGSVSINLDPNANVLKIYANLRTDYSGGSFDTIEMTCNGGVTGDYLWQQGYFFDVYPSAAQGIPDMSIQTWTVPCDGGYNDSALLGQCELTSSNYKSSTSFATFVSNSYLCYPSFLFLNAGVYRGPGPVTSLTFTSETSSNIEPGSVFTVVYQY